MREFRDEEGRPWRIHLTVAAVQRVKAMVTVDTPQFADGEPTGESVPRPFDIASTDQIGVTFQVLHGQFSTLGDVLYAILTQQIEERKMTREQFLDGLRGDSLEAASRVLEEEIIDFFPPRYRRPVALLAAKVREMAAEQDQKVATAIADMKLPDLPGTPSTKPQESLESTPESGPSESSSPPARAA